MRTTILHFPGGHRVRIHTRTARKGAEHFCFIGATVDLCGFLLHTEAALIVFLGKAAFVAGAVAVYLLHAEEAKAARRAAAHALEQHPPG